MTEVKPAQEFDVRVEFSDGADEGPWSLKADHYDIRHANEKKNITEDVIVWRLYDKKPNVLTEDYYEHKSDKRPLDKKPEGNKKSGSERLAKKAKNVERSDVDVDSVLKGVQLEIKSLRDDVDTLKKKVKELQDMQKPVEENRLTGIVTHRDMEVFNRLSPMEKNKYHGGEKWQGITVCKTKICASYKIIDDEYKCESLEIKEGKKESKSEAHRRWPGPAQAVTARDLNNPGIW